MTLKGFHIFFITIATLFSVFLVVWSFFLVKDPSGIWRITGATGCLGLLVMPFYGMWFLRKIRRQHL